jgi:oligopeptide transport system permease protein
MLREHPFWKQGKHFKSNWLAMFGVFSLSGILLMALVGPWLSGHPYYEINLPLKNQSPSFSYWFGTDDLGRDLFTRVCVGARISLLVGIAAALIDLCIGMVWGGIAAFAGGRLDEAMMRTADILYALPNLLIVILLMVILGSGLIPLILGIGLLGWITMARIVRGQILTLKQQDYVLAARALGATSARILFRHLLPNALGPIIVTLTITIPGAMFTEAFLSYLGLGVQAPIPSWGTMASEGLPALQYYPWRLFFPSAFICLSMLSFHLIGDGLQNALDQIMGLDNRA